jgi:hypothetical protein
MITENRAVTGIPVTGHDNRFHRNSYRPQPSNSKPSKVKAFQPRKFRPLLHYLKSQNVAVASPPWENACANRAILRKGS